ncbi:MAG: hypothetical protein HC937_02920 [Aquincola sp.]|nr:hypothetical protein [Aquincola sp.]
MIKVLVALFFLGLNGYVYWYMGNQEVLPPRVAFSEFPNRLEGWQCDERDVLPREVLDNLRREGVHGRAVPPPGVGAQQRLDQQHIVPWSALDIWFDATCRDLRRVVSGGRGAANDPVASKRAAPPNALAWPSEVQEDFLRARFLTSRPSPENLKQALAAFESLSERFPRSVILQEELGRTRLLLGGRKLSDFSARSKPLPTAPLPSTRARPGAFVARSGRALPSPRFRERADPLE